ncbi:protein kinase domain-containing protein [Embleya hyalina]|uniref:non-specific serine/threonine protein kinase n=1 Tax=Embleya hyalina TaxID=516124 RepID=A0A401YPJ8_9ACTN|nr:protein kinase [Embleya hyalina]GCD96521.1 serine/threonine protein kinase [Embleya hyalina]
MEPGRIIGERYETITFMRRSGRGEVWDGRDVLNGRVITLELHPVPSDAAVNLSRGRTPGAARLHHPNVATFLDWGEDRDTLFIVTERLRGRTIEELVGREGPIRSELLYAIAVGICEAMDAGHRIGVVHRDLNPRSVMIIHDTWVKILDFGIVEMLETLVPPARLVTVSCAAPERLTEAGDERTDLYAFGSLLFLMATGRAPFVGADAAEIMRRKAFESAPRLDTLRPDAPPALTALVAHLLERDPARRPWSAGMVRIRLDDLSWSRPDSGPSIPVGGVGAAPPPSEPPPPSAPRRVPAQPPEAASPPRSATRDYGPRPLEPAPEPWIAPTSAPPTSDGRPYYAGRIGGRIRGLVDRLRGRRAPATTPLPVDDLPDSAARDVVGAPHAGDLEDLRDPVAETKPTLAGLTSFEYGWNDDPYPRSADPSAPAAMAPGDLDRVDAQVINFRVEDVPADAEGRLRVGQAYVGVFRVGADDPRNLAEGERRIPVEDIPFEGLRTTWVVWSNTVMLEAHSGLVAAYDGVEVSVAEEGDRAQWMARFDLLIPPSGESTARRLRLVPRVAEGARIDVMVFVGEDVYRELAVRLDVSAVTPPAPEPTSSTLANPAAPSSPTASTTPLAARTPLAPPPPPPPPTPPAQWTPPTPPPPIVHPPRPLPPIHPGPRPPRVRSATRTPPVRTGVASLHVTRSLPARHTRRRAAPAEGRRHRVTLSLFLIPPQAQWEQSAFTPSLGTESNTHGQVPWTFKDVARQRVAEARRALEEVRELLAEHCPDITPADLEARLAHYRFGDPTRPDASASGTTDPTVRDTIARDRRMRNLAYAGARLRDAFFPPGTMLRERIDALGPGDNLRITWYPEPPYELPHVPWGLMYRGSVPAQGTPIDANDFLGLRLRIAHRAHRRESDRALEPAATRAHLLYWGTGATDETARAAREHEAELRAWTPLLLPATTIDRKAELAGFLRSPTPRPVSLVYVYCQCTTGTGAAPVLRFGASNDDEDVLELVDLGDEPFADQPLVFVNACETASADAFFTNELRETFLSRGCRAYIGTECKVPTVFAARFATVFFHFLYARDHHTRHPTAVGDALAQARRFFRNVYGHPGGLFYSAVDDDQVFVARPDEVAAAMGHRTPTSDLGHGPPRKRRS